MRISDWSSDVCSSDLTIKSRPAASGSSTACWTDVKDVYPRAASASPSEDGRLVKDIQYPVGNGEPGSDRPASRAPLAPLAPHRYIKGSANGHGTDRRWGRWTLWRSEEHSFELQSQLRISYAV